MAKTRTIVNFLLDETGSMLNCKQATIDGFNEYLDTLRQSKENIKFTLTTFNSKSVDTRCVNEAVSKVKKLTNKTYKPDMLTPLYDAMGQTIRETEEAIKKSKLKTKPKVLFVVMTDGEENASKEFTRKDMITRIKEKEKDGWTFLFLGADFDSYIEGMKVGMRAGGCLQIKKGQMARGMSSLGRSTVMFAVKQEAGKSTKNFKEEYWDEK
jgi:hypothetical protein